MRAHRAIVTKMKQAKFYSVVTPDKNLTPQDLYEAMLKHQSEPYVGSIYDAESFSGPDGIQLYLHPVEVYKSPDDMHLVFEMSGDCTWFPVTTSNG